MRTTFSKTAKQAFLCLLVFFALIQKATAEKPNLWIEDGFILSSIDGFIVTPVDNQTGASFDADITGIIEANIKEQLVSAQLAVFPSDASDKNAIVIRSQLTFYQAGSALERWVGLFGYSAVTGCAMRVMLEDSSSGELVGDMVVIRSIGGGLFGAPGAEEKILEDIAKHAVAAISKQLKSEKGEP